MLTKEENDQLFEAIATAKDECKNVYAQSYLSALDEAGTLYGNEGLKTQILYVLSNMSCWRGEIARTTKKTLRALVEKM